MRVTSTRRTQWSEQSLLVGMKFKESLMGVSMTSLLWDQQPSTWWGRRNGGQTGCIDGGDKSASQIKLSPVSPMTKHKQL